MLIKAILVGLVLGLCKSEWIYGFPQVGRPIVVSTLTGLFLGDPVQGVIMGSVLELMFIGSFPIGAAVSPDYTSAGAICTAFAILTGGGKAVATAMALPIALLGGFIFIGCKLMNAAFGQIMMKYLEKDDSKGASRIYIMGSVFTCFVVYFAYAFVCIFAGSAAVEAAVNAIPKVIINGLAASANLLPAVGFALLLQMVITKKMSPYFFIGFILAAYLSMPTIALNCMNDYPGQMHNGYTFSLLPVLDKIYKDNKEERIKAKKRHMEYFNITPNIAGFALGISTAMEEENAKNPEFDDTTINTVKTALMGPLSAIGDTLFPATLRILATSLVITMAAAGNVFAPILFLLIYNIPNYLARWYSLKYGYSMGMEFMVKSQKSGIMDKVSYACTVVGLMAIGAMIFYTVNISTPITIGNVKNGGIVLQTTLDTVMPGMLKIALVGIEYWLLKKGVK